jgi:hypothetical protein
VQYLDIFSREKLSGCLNNFVSNVGLKGFLAFDQKRKFCYLHKNDTKRNSACCMILGIRNFRNYLFFIVS